MRAVAVAVCVLAMFVAVQAQTIPWTPEFIAKHSNVNGTRFRVPHCDELAARGASEDNCWRQTRGQNDGVKITEYYVSSSRFPCTSGTSATTWVFDTTKQMNDMTCAAKCSGFGCKNGNVNLCSDIGLPNCPQPAGKFESVGKSGECQSGIGDYKVVIDCGALFSIDTFISY